MPSYVVFFRFSQRILAKNDNVSPRIPISPFSKIYMHWRLKNFPSRHQHVF
jgi:hypothetical protein